MLRCGVAGVPTIVDKGAAERCMGKVGPHMSLGERVWQWCQLGFARRWLKVSLPQFSPSPVGNAVRREASEVSGRHNFRRLYRACVKHYESEGSLHVDVTPSVTAHLDIGPARPVPLSVSWVESPP